LTVLLQTFRILSVVDGRIPSGKRQLLEGRESLMILSSNK
jgi:hypothetical protein